MRRFLVWMALALFIPTAKAEEMTMKFGTFKRRVATKDESPPPSLNQFKKDLPVVEVAAASPEKEWFAIIVSGDGGWAGIDREIAKILGEAGVPVVGLNSLKYFWKRRTPEEASKDLERIIRHYYSAWGKKSVMLIGYSRGADVLPFMANRLPAELLKKIGIIALLGPETSVDFEIHPGDFLNMGSNNARPILPEIEKLKGSKILCFYGEDEKDSLCRELPAGVAEVVQMKGGHHFGGDYQKITKEILRRLP
jgi:type IV secretory pathway VirJ component